MKKLFLVVLFLPLLAFANGLDHTCPKHVYKSAPIIKADQYICYKQYGVAYNYKTKTPIYTTEYLEADDTGDEPRVDSFRPDPSIPRKYSASLSDYKGTTTECFGDPCDRGHMTPNQDFSSCAECALESFYLTNIVPQNARNNRIIWKYLEAKVRSYAAKRNPVYVITGTVYLAKPYTTIGKGVAIPDKLFKVVIDSKVGNSIAFMMDNKYYPVGDLNGKVVALSEIEKVTGIEFHSSLDKTSSASYQEWFSGLK